MKKIGKKAPVGAEKNNLINNNSKVVIVPVIEVAKMGSRKIIRDRAAKSILLRRALYFCRIVWKKFPNMSMTRLRRRNLLTIISINQI